MFWDERSVLNRTLDERVAELCAIFGDISSLLALFFASWDVCWKNSLAFMWGCSCFGGRTSSGGGDGACGGDDGAGVTFTGIDTVSTIGSFLAPLAWTFFLTRIFLPSVVLGNLLGKSMVRDLKFSSKYFAISITDLGLDILIRSHESLLHASALFLVSLLFSLVFSFSSLLDFCLTWVVHKKNS